MNNKLKKDAGKLAGYAYQKSYMKSHTKVCITLDNTEDADIITWLNQHKNRSAFIRDAIRRDRATMEETGKRMQDGFNEGLKGMKEKA